MIEGFLFKYFYLEKDSELAERQLLKEILVL